RQTTRMYLSWLEARHAPLMRPHETDPAGFGGDATPFTPAQALHIGNNSGLFKLQRRLKFEGRRATEFVEWPDGGVERMAGGDDAVFLDVEGGAPGISRADHGNQASAVGELVEKRRRDFINGAVDEDH